MQQLNLSIEALERIIDWYYTAEMESQVTMEDVDIVILIQKYVEANKCNQEGSNTGSTSSAE